MKKITALKVQKRNPNRVNVYLDGEFAFGLARIVAAWLKVGQTLSEEKIAALLAQDAEEVAYQRALRFLSLRPRSEAEVRRNLEKHQVSAEVIDQVLARLRRSGLVDDTAFARLWVENRVTFRPRGARALRQELRQRGVPDPIIQQALTDLDEDVLAEQAARKYVHKVSDLSWPEFRRKLGGFLARRGFNYDVIAPVVERLWAERDSDPTTAEPELENED